MQNLLCVIQPPEHFVRSREYFEQPPPVPLAGLVDKRLRLLEVLDGALRQVQLHQQDTEAPVDINELLRVATPLGHRE